MLRGFAVNLLGARLPEWRAALDGTGPAAHGTGARQASLLLLLLVVVVVVVALTWLVLGELTVLRNRGGLVKSLRPEGAEQNKGKQERDRRSANASGDDMCRPRCARIPHARIRLPALTCFGVLSTWRSALLACICRRYLDCTCGRPWSAHVVATWIALAVAFGLRMFFLFGGQPGSQRTHSHPHSRASQHKGRGGTNPHA